MSAYKKLSIIIVNYRSRVYLKKCLDSIFRFNHGIDLEFIVVNNDEEENLDELKIKFPSLTLIDSSKNNGFGWACNLGAEKAKGDLLFFLNPDTEILNSLTPIIEEFQKDSNLGAIGPRLIEENGKFQEWSVGNEISLGSLIENNLRLTFSKKFHKSRERKEAAWVSGAALFVPKEIFSGIGGFDKKFFMYFEDNDLCKRIRQTGKKIFHFPEVIIKHYGGRSFAREREKKDYFYQSQEYYFLKHLGSWQVFGLRVLKKIFLDRTHV